jgi:hypothetical protein
MSVQGFQGVAGEGKIISRRPFLRAFWRYEHFLHESCRRSMKEIYRIVNEAIRTQDPGGDQAEGLTFDLSKVR